MRAASIAAATRGLFPDPERLHHALPAVRPRPLGPPVRARVDPAPAALPDASFPFVCRIVRDPERKSRHVLLEGNRPMAAIGRLRLFTFQYAGLLRKVDFYE